MVSIEIPIDFSEDPDIKKILEENKQCQAEFQVVYEAKELVSQTTLVDKSLFRILKN